MQSQENDNRSAHMADEYDGKVRVTIPFYDHFHSQAIDLVKTLCPSPAAWLDTGCGTGNLLLLAADAFPDTIFTAADPSTAMLEIAAGKLCSIPAERIYFLPPAGSGELDLLEGSFSVITAIQSHHYLDEDRRRKATENCHRMLASKGVYITFENIRPLTDAGTQAGLERWRRFQELQGKTFEEAEQHIQRFGKEYFPITISEHLALLRETGFQCVEILWASHLQAGFYAVKA